MTNSSRLNDYIVHLRQRLRVNAWLRGATIFAAIALVVTISLVLLLNHFAFPSHGVTLARVTLIAALAAAAILGIVLPILRLTRAHAVQYAETATPELQDRLTTFEERASRGDDPFLELLAADTLTRTEEAKPSSLVPDQRLFAFAGAGLGCIVVLLWLIAAGPGFVGYGASLLWTGPKKNAASYYSIAVIPGNVVARRNSDQLIAARITGMRPEKAQLFAHYQSAAGWEPVAMQPVPDVQGGAAYQFVLAGLPEDVEYYVAAGPLVSPHYKVRVVDLPSVKDIHVTYHYPQWTGMKPESTEHSGDLRAIEGTDAEIEISMDHPLKDGQLTIDGGTTLHLKSRAGNTYQATLHMEKDGAYHVAAVDEGQPVRLSEDYFIATDKAVPPQISINRPGGDYRASPIEEVTVGAQASGEFSLKDFHLHYSVNGGSDHDINLLKVPGTKSASGTTVLPLENFKLVPGDIISVYATARDGNSESRTDISFIQVDPFEREFSQSQQSGGGGGGGGANSQTEISKREKELIAATWKQQNDKIATAKDTAAQGQFLSDAQHKLRDQVNALSVRMQSRDISGANEEFSEFDKDMQAAAAAMGPSADKLKSMQWKDAVPQEQKALQALLRAEATFRQIEVAFGQRGGGGSGGGNSGRDLASLFDLELDTEKNQYETAQSASPAEQHQKDVEDALEKLDALAKREQDLASQQHDPQQSFQQRWQQEMLRREAEQLQQQMQQMAKNSQQSSGGSSGSSQDQQSSQQSGAQGQNSSQSSRSSTQQQSQEQQTDPRVAQALSRLQQATDAMQRNGGSPQQSADAAQQAAEKLRDATSLLSGAQQQLATGSLHSLTREAGRLTDEEHTQADRINQLANESNGSGAGDNGAMDLQSALQRLHERDQLAGERQQLSDDLSNLQSSLRSAARQMAPNQPDAAEKLRDALTQMDQSDLDNHVQRTADWLRRGINPNSNGTEAEIAQGLSKLSQQLQQAEGSMGAPRPGQRGTGQQDAGQGDPSAALGQVARLRSQIESLSREGGNRGQPSAQGQGSQGKNAQGGQRGGQQAGNGSGLGRNGQPSNQMGPGGQQSGWNSPQQPLRRSGEAGSAQQTSQSGNGNRSGASGETRNGKGGADGTVWGDFDTGNNTPHARGSQQAAPRDASGNPADTERTIEQSVRELNQIRQMVHDDPQAAKEVNDLTHQMQNLNPNRFPGNPAMVEQMHREVLSAMDKLELQLERDGAGAEARTGKADAIPGGYQESVAEYYRQLSKKQ